MVFHRKRSRHLPAREGIRFKEDAEDDTEQAVTDLKAKKVSNLDIVVGLAASGNTRYTLSALEFARSRSAKTVAIVSVPGSPMSKPEVTVNFVGPEVITGSTRMKSGTAQKMALNMISTATMVRLGMTYSNWMINVAMTNQNSATAECRFCAKFSVSMTTN